MTVKALTEIVAWTVFSITVSVGVSLWLFSFYSSQTDSKLDESRFDDYRVHMDTKLEEVKGSLSEIKTQLSGNARDTKQDLEALRLHLDSHWGRLYKRGDQLAE
jgi:hypothetical protein